MDRLNEWWIVVTEAYEMEPVISRMAIGVIIFATVALATWLAGC